MAKKTIDELTPEQTEALTEEQYNALQQDGAVDMPDDPESEKKPEQEKEKQPPQQEGEKEPAEDEEKQPEGKEGKEAEEGKESEPFTITKEQWEEAQRKMAELEKSDRGKTVEIVKLRHKNRELETVKPPEQSELVKRILALEDGDVLDAATVKEGLLADQKKQEEAERLRQKRIDEIEAAKEIAMATHDDYQDVITKGLPAYVESLPADKRKEVIDEITNAADPAETAYKYGAQGMKKPEPPAEQQKEVKETPKQQTPAQTPAQKEQPVILRSGKGGTTSTADKSIEELVFGNYTAEQLEQMAVAAEKERNKGG